MASLRAGATSLLVREKVNIRTRQGGKHVHTGGGGMTNNRLHLTRKRPTRRKSTRQRPASLDALATCRAAARAACGEPPARECGSRRAAALWGAYGDTDACV
eukprot:7376542-Prymnesium_polylepis.1